MRCQQSRDVETKGRGFAVTGKANKQGPTCRWKKCGKLLLYLKSVLQSCCCLVHLQKTDVPSGEITPLLQTTDAKADFGNCRTDVMSVFTFVLITRD